MRKIIMLIFSFLVLYSSSCLAWSQFAALEPFSMDGIVKEINSNNTYNGDLKITKVELYNSLGEYHCQLSDNKSVMAFSTHNDYCLSLGVYADANNYQAPINTLYSIFERCNVGKRSEFWEALEKSYKTKKGQFFAMRELGNGEIIYWAVEAKNFSDGYNNYIFVGISCWFTG